MDVHEESLLNISCEHFQQNRWLRVVNENVLKKCLEMLAEMAEKRDDHKKLYEQFGKSLNWTLTSIPEPHDMVDSARQGENHQPSE